MKNFFSKHAVLILLLCTPVAMLWAEGDFEGDSSTAWTELELLRIHGRHDAMGALPEPYEEYRPGNFRYLELREGRLEFWGEGDQRGDFRDQESSLSKGWEFETNSSLRLDLNTFLRRIQPSYDQDFSLALSLDGLGSYSYLDYGDYYFEKLETVGLDGQSQATLHWKHIHYWDSFHLELEADSTVAGGSQFDWFDPSDNDFDYQVRLNGGVGLGMGRLYDVTAMTRAMTLVAFLQKRGALTRSVSKVHLLELARLLALKENEFYWDSRERQRLLSAHVWHFLKERSYLDPGSALAILLVDDLLRTSRDPARQDGDKVTLKINGGWDWYDWYEGSAEGPRNYRLEWLRSRAVSRLLQWDNSLSLNLDQRNDTFLVQDQNTWRLGVWSHWTWHFNSRHRFFLRTLLSARRFLFIDSVDGLSDSKNVNFSLISGTDYDLGQYLTFSWLAGLVSRYEEDKIYSFSRRFLLGWVARGSVTYRIY